MTAAPYPSSSVDDCAGRLRDSALRNAAAADPAARWACLALTAEIHRRAAALIDAEAAQIAPPEEPPHA